MGGDLVRVTDDGIRMDTAVLEYGRPGHFGLLGTRERAARIGGKLTITSAPGACTVVTLVVPGGLAFRSEQRRSPFAISRGGGSRTEKKRRT